MVSNRLVSLYCLLRRAGDPVAPQRPQRRSLRSPELQSSPRTGISLNGNRRRRRRPHHRPERVEQHRAAQAKLRRAGFSATTRQGIKNTSSPAGNVGERARRRPQSARLSIRAVGAGDPVAPQRPQRRSLRSPELQSSPRTGISLNGNRRRRRRPHHRPERVEQHRAAQAKLRRAGFSATTRQGIKNTSSPAGNVGERARRRPSLRGFRSGLSAPATR